MIYINPQIYSKSSFLACSKAFSATACVLLAFRAWLTSTAALLSATAAQGPSVAAPCAWPCWVPRRLRAVGALGATKAAPKVAPTRATPSVGGR